MTNVSQPPRSNFSARPSKLGFINNVNAGLILFTLSIIIISIFYGSILVVDHVLRFSEGKHLLVTNGNNNLLRGNSYSAESSISTASKSLLPNDSFHSTTFLSRQVGQIPKQGNHHNAYSHSISSVSTELDRKPIGFEDHNDFLKANEDSFLTLPSNLDKNVNILIGAWIYLDGERNDMRTIVSNKGSGCDNKDAQFGISLYVNGWASQDRRLYTEVGTKESGCYKLHSGSYMLELERWHHVAVYSANRSLALFLDGKVVALSEMKPSREPQLHRHLIAGQYDPASSSTSYPLFGRISRIVITSPKIPLLVVMEESNSYIEDVMAVPSTHTKLIDGVAFYPLNDAGALVDGSKATEVWKGFHGTYTFPSFLPGVSITGVKIPLVTGFKLSGATPSPPLNKQIYIARQAEIKKSTARVWAAYKRYAWGADELKPVSRSSSNTWGHMGMTLLDSLDTLWLLGLRKEFEEASTWVANTLIFQPPGAVSTFETTIRAFGGLLAAFDLSGQASLLERAKELGDFLFPAFDTESGVPFSQVIFSQRKGLDGWNGHNSLLAEMGTLQIEFRALSYFTGDDKYEKAAMRPIQLMASLKPPHGLYPLKISCKDGAFAEHRVTFGAMGDSFYEYLLKTWIQGGKKEDWLRRMYDDAMDGVVEKLLSRSAKSGLAFLSDWDLSTGKTTRKMDHLVCFLPGLLALGSINDPLGADSSRAVRDMTLAKSLMYTCYEMYHSTKSGISPEYVIFPDRGVDIEVPDNAAFYILRPEVAESLFVMAQLTNETVYRDWAWEIWKSIDKHCRIENGYASLKDVQNPQKGVDDRMESFFLAETIKYLYLAQDIENQLVNLQHSVLNTEAHPLRIFDNWHHSVVEAYTYKASSTNINV